jgi:hypothetical protein
VAVVDGVESHQKRKLAVEKVVAGAAKTRPEWNLAVVAVMSGWSKLAKSAFFISFVIG